MAWILQHRRFSLAGRTRLVSSKAQSSNVQWAQLPHIADPAVFQVNPVGVKELGAASSADWAIKTRRHRWFDYLLQLKLFGVKVQEILDGRLKVS